MRVFDCHVHVAPWAQMPPATRELFSRHWRDRERLERAISDPDAFLRLMDEEGVERAALVNYVSPDVMGFDASVNGWVADLRRGHEARLLAGGSVHRRHTRYAAGDTARLFEKGIRILKVHPPHQLFAANAHVHGDDALAAIYRTAEQHRIPV